MMRVLLLCLLFITPVASAQVYTYIDAEGNRVFTDKPRSSNAERVMLAPSNNVELSQPAPTVRMAPAPAVSKPTVHYQVLRILVPEPDASIHNGSGEMIVTLSSEPGLLPETPPIEAEGCLIEAAVNDALSDTYAVARALLAARLDSITLADLAADFSRRLAAHPKRDLLHAHQRKSDAS